MPYQALIHGVNAAFEEVNKFFYLCDDIRIIPGKDCVSVRGTNGTRMHKQKGLLM